MISSPYLGEVLCIWMNCTFLSEGNAARIVGKQIWIFGILLRFRNRGTDELCVMLWAGSRSRRAWAFYRPCSWHCQCSARSSQRPCILHTGMHLQKHIAVVLVGLLERLLNDSRKPNHVKIITLTNHNEPSRIPSRYLWLAQSAGKITRAFYWVLLLVGRKIGARLKASH